MTGREQKVYYSYSQISHKHSVPDDGLPPQSQLPPPPGKEAKAPGFALPELEHNLQLLIDLTEQEIIQSDRQLQYERDMVVNLSHELEKMSEVLEHEERVIANLSKVLEMVEECERRMQPACSDPLTLDECARVFETLQDKYYEEYRMSDRVDLAVAIVYPLVKEYFKEWDPLKVSGWQDGPGLEGPHGAGSSADGCVSPQDCVYGTEVISRWKSLLENDQLLSHGGQDLSADAFHRYWAQAGGRSHRGRRALASAASSARAGPVPGVRSLTPCLSPVRAVLCQVVASLSVRGMGEVGGGEEADK